MPSSTTVTKRAAFLEGVRHRRSRRQQEQTEVSGDTGSSSSTTDTTAENSPIIVEHRGYPITYTCNGSDNGEGDTDTTTSTNTKTLQFHFDYEFVMKDPRESLVEVFYEDLPVLEFGILWSAAQAVGLNTCNLEDQDIGQWRPIGADDANGDGRRLQGSRSMIEESHVVSLSSMRTDVIDPTTESCQYLVNIAVDDICLPMRGKMMAQYTGDDTEAVENYLLYHIGIEIDSQRVLLQQIKQILFLGDRATYGPQELGPIASNSSNVGLAVSLSLSLSLLVIALSVVIGRRRRRVREESFEALNISKDGIMDIPHGNTGSLHSGESNECSSLNSQDAEVPSSNVNTSVTEQQAMDLIMDDISNCPSDSPALHPQDLAVNAKMVDMLPPLAPGTRSKTMKKRRRKKKKVKRKLTRTNSRENINEMATITEANEEVLSDDDDSNSGTNSEYYSTDDEDSVGRTSRDPSPSRSRTGSLGSVASGGSGGVPPSPIKEEPEPPRIPRLPPPYV